MKEIDELRDEIADYQRRLKATDEKWRQLDDEALAYSKCVRAIEGMMGGTGSIRSAARSDPSQRRVIDALAARFGVNLIDHARLTSMFNDSYFGVSPSEKEELEELRQMRKMIELIGWPMRFQS